VLRTIFVIAFMTGAGGSPARADLADWGLTAGYGAGTFAVSGDFARDHVAEGGPLLAFEGALRIDDVELLGGLTFARGAAELGFSDYGLRSRSLTGRWYLPVVEGYAATTGHALELFALAGVQRVAIARDERRALAAVWGGGVHARLRAGRRERAGFDASLFLELRQARTDVFSGGDLGDTRIRTVVLGMRLGGGG
jgi:hypothetical protein